MTTDITEVDRAQIERLRREKRLTRDQLILAAGIDEADMAAIETRSAAPRQAIVKLANALCVSPDALIPPSEGATSTWNAKAVWAGVLLGVLILVSFKFGYGIGADVAARENRAECVASGGADCNAPR